MNDLFIDFSDKEPYQFLNQTFPKKKKFYNFTHIMDTPFKE